MTKIFGEIEFVNKRAIGGWAAAGGTTRPITVSLRIDGIDFGETQSNIFRSDIVERELGEGWSGWVMPMPQGISADEPHVVEITLSFENSDKTHLVKDFSFESREIRHFVDFVRPVHIYGWAKYAADDDMRLELALIEGNNIVSKAYANNFRGEVHDAGIGDGRYGFVLPIPLDLRTKPTEASLAVIEPEGRIRKIQDVYLDRSSVRILFVTDTLHEGNASRYYRAVIQSKLLWQSGSEVAIIDKSEVKAGSFEGYSVVILQRAPANAAIVSECLRAKVNQTLILYETDDLNTAPDLVGETGAIRSAFRNPQDEAFLREMNGRLVSSNIADAVIASNRFMARFYRSRGYDVVLSPFLCEPQTILRKRKRDFSNNWNLLYYSGSPTHRKDFEIVHESLVRFLTKHHNARLTVLGHVSREDFAGIPRTTFLAATDYQGLLARIDEHDCVIAPFEKSTYNYGKSCTKFIETASRGVSLIVSALPDYVPHITRSGFGSLVRSPYQWFDTLESEYGRRHEKAEDSADLCTYARNTFSLQTASNDVLSQIFAMYRKRVCRA